MKKDSLLLKYKKKLKENSNSNNLKKIKNNYINKLFIRIFLSSVLLLFFVLADHISLKRNKKPFSKYTLESNINYLNVINLCNSVFGNIININQEEINVNSNIIYSNIDYKNNINIISDYTKQNIVNIKEGIVIKKYKNEDGTTSITILTNDNYYITYNNLSNTDLTIYSYVSKGTIIGTSTLIESNYVVYLTIEKEGEYYEYEKFE